MTAAIPIFEEIDYVTERGKQMPDWNHAIAQTNIAFGLKLAYGKRFRIVTEANTALKARDRVPDVSIYPPSTFDPDNNVINMTPPLCAIEILSEMQSLSQLKKKGKEYFDAGTLSYWLVLPSLQTIYVFSELNKFRIFTHEDILKDAVLGIELDLAEVFS